MATCECGRPKEPGAEACEWCLELDGRTIREARVLRALHSLSGWSDLTAIEGVTGMSRSNVSATLRPLIESGRVSRLEIGPQDAVLFVLKPERKKKMPKKQTEIPGTERDVIEEIENAAMAYVEARDTRMEQLKEEKREKESLLAIMERLQDKLERDTEGNAVYTYYDGERRKDVILETKTTRNVRVREHKAEDEDNVIDLDTEAVAVG